MSDQSSANSLASLIKNNTTAKIAGCVTAHRRATILLSSFVASDTVTINGVVFTGKASPDAGDPREFLIGSTDAKSAENLLQAINKVKAKYFAELGENLLSVSRSTATLTINYDGTLTAAISAHGTVTSTIVVLTAIAPGQHGNLFTLAISAGGTVSGAALTGGTEGTEYVFSRSRSVL